MCENKNIGKTTSKFLNGLCVKQKILFEHLCMPRSLIYCLDSVLYASLDQYEEWRYVNKWEYHFFKINKGIV